MHNISFYVPMQDKSMMSVSSSVLNNKLTPLMVALVASSALFLSACSDSNTPADTKQAEAIADLSMFAGCYAVSHDGPAQIRVSQQGGAWVMQMKEPASAKRVWDDAEPLEVLAKSDIPTYFSIDPDNVDAVIGRPDRVLVLAHVKPVYANIYQLLDSEYLSYIYRGANTIYRVECDEVNTDILANPHSNIV